MSRPGFFSGGLTYDVAGPADGRDLARLQALPMAGDWLSLSVSAVGNYWRAAAMHGEHAAIICRRPDGTALGMCARSVRQAYVDGAARPLGYLGALRVDDKGQHRPRLVRDGFEAVRRLLHDPARTPYCLTAIAEGNHAAERLLTAGLPGMPRYRPAGELFTLAIGTSSARHRRQGLGIRRASVADLPEITACLARNHARYQFAPVWRAADFSDQHLCPNLRVDDFLLAHRDGRLVGCLALWDQRPVKQLVVAGYDRRLARWRHVLNAVAPWFGWPRLPSAGSALAQAYLSHVAVEDDDAQVLVALIEAARGLARGRGLDLVLIGLGEGNVMFHEVTRVFRHRAYRSKLFLVSWPDGHAAAGGIDIGIPHPEVAIL